MLTEEVYYVARRDSQPEAGQSLTENPCYQDVSQGLISLWLKNLIGVHKSLNNLIFCRSGFFKITFPFTCCSGRSIVFEID